MAVDMCDHTAPLSAHHTCAEDGDFKCPHPPNIGGDILLDRWLACRRTAELWVVCLDKIASKNGVKFDR
jgi:hypothetical protein